MRENAEDKSRDGRQEEEMRGTQREMGGEKEDVS